MIISYIKENKFTTFAIVLLCLIVACQQYQIRSIDLKASNDIDIVLLQHKVEKLSKQTDKIDDQVFINDNNAQVKQMQKELSYQEQEIREIKKYLNNIEYNIEMHRSIR